MISSLSASSLVSLGSTQDLLSVSEAQQQAPQSDNVEQVVCHVDFDKLHAAACRLHKLQKQSDKKHVQHRRQTDPSQIVHAVLHLAREKQKQNGGGDDACSVVIPRKVYYDIDSMIDECVAVLNTESEWFEKNVQKQLDATTTSAPPRQQAIKQGTTMEKDEWDELLEIVSDSFDGTTGLDTSLTQLVESSASNKEGVDPLIMFAEYWDNNDDTMDTATPDSNDDAISIVTVSSTQTEQDPLDLFPEYWGLEQDEDISTFDMEYEPLSI